MNPISQKLVVIKEEEDTLEAKIHFKIDAYSQSLIAKSCQLNQHDIKVQSKKCFKVCSNSKLDLENCSRNCFEKFEKLQEYNRSAEFMGIFKKQQQK